MSPIAKRGVISARGIGEPRSVAACGVKTWRHWLIFRQDTTWRCRTWRDMLTWRQGVMWRHTASECGSEACVVSPKRVVTRLAPPLGIRRSSQARQPQDVTAGGATALTFKGTCCRRMSGQSVASVAHAALGRWVASPGVKVWRHLLT